MTVVVEPGARVGEGARWDERVGALWWVDIPTGDIHRYDTSTGLDSSIAVGERVGSVALRDGGGVVACTETGVVAVDWPAGRTEVVADLCADDPDLRCNDSSVDAHGRLWVGTMSMTFRRGVGALHRVEPGGVAAVVLDGLDMPNGMGWSPDGTTMYLVDTFARTIWTMEFDLDRGTVGDRRPLVRADGSAGLPDGLAVDVDGRLWVAWFRGAAVRVYDSGGTLVDALDAPTWQVTSVAFGGDRLRDLYVTSASEHLTIDERATQPLAGAVFRLPAAGCGQAPAHFSG